ncbi:MAG: ShlB/FhaC/HecB family hemolysin secretion/activation protein [Halioglobus sp.]
MFKLLRTVGVILTIALATVTDTLASPFPNSGSLYRDVRDDSLRQTNRLKPEADTLPSIESGQSQEISAPEIPVTHFVVYGNSILSDDELSDLFAPYSHRTITGLELETAMNALRDTYRRNGLFVAQVYLPPQAVEDGVVTLHVYEGTLEENGVALANQGDHVKSKMVSSILEENLVTGELIRREEFERTILLVDDLPGITSHSAIYPGSEPGEARFLLQTEDTPRVTGNVDLDNFGNYYTGEERLGTTLYFNSPTKNGDQLTFRGVTSGSDSNYAFAEYSIPIAGSGLRVGGSADYLDYELGEELDNLELKGDAWSARLFAAYPLIRARHKNVTAHIDYSYLDLNDDDGLLGDLESERNLHTVTARLYGDHDDDWLASGVTYFDVGTTAGSVDVEGGDAFADFDDKNVGTDGSFAKFNVDFSRLQHLTGNWSALARIAGQWSSTNLDTSQKFYLGGPFSNPGYPVGEMSGDHGANLQADVRYDVRSIPWGGDLQLSVFYSAGWVQLFEDPWDGWQGANPIISNNLTLYSWGVAASQTWPSGVVLRSSIGRQIGDNDARNPITGDATDQSDDDYRAWFQVIYYFGGV